MRIVLNGVETNNKGAELMLYAILQEIERRFPSATVYMPIFSIRQGLDYVKTDLDIRFIPNARILRLSYKFGLPGILRRLRLPYLWATDTSAIQDIDYFIDASGFAISDQWAPTRYTYSLWNNKLKGYYEQGSKIIFLPQAFGPIEKQWTKKLVSVLSEKSSLIYARERLSYRYLQSAGVDKNKLRMSTDFTSLVNGIIPQSYKNLFGAVAIIPNQKMIDSGTIELDGYLSNIKTIIDVVRQHGYKAYLLNHEGEEDEKLCHLIKNKVDVIPIVSGLNALEVKGLISTAYLCVTSRFHGLASALNSCVPCLATGWSHKYEELYRDYDVDGCMLDVNAHNDMRRRVSRLLDETNNKNMREHLKARQPAIQNAARRMWDEIWSI